MAKCLWMPSAEEAAASNMHAFMQRVNARYNMTLTSYEELWEWSVNHISPFWSEMWDFSGIIASRPFQSVVDDEKKMPGAKWFGGARLNFAENLLRYRDGRTALIFKNEVDPPFRMTYAELYEAVSRLAASLKSAGITPGDRVVGFMPNIPETVVAMLAATSIGAVWSSCSPDFGIKGVLDRFSQIRPKLLFTADGYLFKGKRFDSLEKISGIIKELPSIETVVVVPYTGTSLDIGQIPNALVYETFIDDFADAELACEQLPFEHPLYIMYSSGTTGLPKCMVQGAGGVLINHLKELMLHTDLKKDDIIFYYTTCGWMMWNWLVSSLAVGAAVVLYDGNPFYPTPDTLWRMVQEERISIMGVSAGYINALQNTGIFPGREYDPAHLRAVLSTGSPLSEEGFEYIYNAVKTDVRLSSISGGSDINGCFVAGNPMGPVYAGEIQCRALGMNVHAFDESGRSVVNRRGELVCVSPSPSMPIYFWNDPEGKKYHSAYFDVYPGAWRHGDFISINDRGGVVIYGRSDATLNPGGVRIGTAEIYRQVERFTEIEDSLVIGQPWKGDTRVILFVKLSEESALNDGLKSSIRSAIMKHASPRHVPSKILAVPDIPYTLNMKKVELAVKQTVEGCPVMNKDALINPESLEFFTHLPELAED
ncbi:MAG: acetoacetate--CoA ligase [Desulfobacterales bacterium]